VTVRLAAPLCVCIAVLAARVCAQRIKLPYPLSQLEQRAHQDSNDAAVQYELGLGYWNAKRWDDAERVLRLSVQIEPRFAQGYLALAYVPFARHPELMKIRDPALVPDSLKPSLEESRRFERRAFTIDPLVDLRIIGVVFPPGAGPFQAFVDGQYGLAFWFFQGAVNQQGVKAAPPGLLWYAGLAAAHVAAYPQAVADLQALLDRELAREQDSTVHVPLAANEVRYVLAIVKQKYNKPADAIALYREVLSNDIGMFMAHVQMAHVYEQNSMWKDAAAEQRLAVATDPEDPSLLTDLGILLRQADSLAESETVLRQAMDGNARDPRPPYYLGLTELQMGKAPEARAAFQRFLAMAPSRDSAEIAEVHRYIVMLH
jgi:Tfp pilus assembly protein PilF